MSNFVPLAVLDVWSLAASLRSRMNMFRRGETESVADPTTRVLLRQPNDEGDAVNLVEWPHLANVLSRIVRLPKAQGQELGSVYLAHLRQGSFVQWHADPPRGWQTLHLPIVTNPGAWMYSGPQSAHLESGVLTWVNAAALCSEVNFGEFPRIHLVLEVRPKPPDQP
jgi:hypothetical protein